jgi:hypothetical protein
VNASIRKSLARMQASHPARRLRRQAVARPAAAHVPGQQHPAIERAERMHLLARRVGLVEEIDRRLRLLKYHRPYHESDHVLNIAYNILCDGDCLQDLERLRNDEAYLDALGAQRIPDPTTAGDFCRRFESADQVDALMDAINSVRAEVWKQQPPSLLRSGDHRRRRHHRPDRRGMQEGTWTSVTTANGATMRWWCRWPTRVNRCSCSTVRATVPATKRGGLFGQDHRSDAGRRLPGSSLRGDTDFSANGLPGPVGRSKRRGVPLRHRCHAQSLKVPCGIAR